MLAEALALRGVPGLRVFWDQRASVLGMNVPHLIMGVGSIFAGVASLKKGFESRNQRPIEAVGDAAPVVPSSKGGPRATIRNVTTIDERLKGVMEQMLKSIRDPNVRMLAAQIVSRRCSTPNDKTGDGGWCIGEKEYWPEVKAVFNWMRANVRYVRDIHSIDTFQQAMRTIQARSGDCDDYTIALGALLMSLGYPVRTKTIQTKDSDDWNHIYLQVGLPPGKPTKWKTLDASVPRPAGWEAPESIIAKARVDYPHDSKWGFRGLRIR
jgi:predicted transglutaminase-like cysteine proteinase